MSDYISHVEVSVFSRTVALKHWRIKLENCYFKKLFKCENDGRVEAILRRKINEFLIVFHHAVHLENIGARNIFFTVFMFFFLTQ